MGGNLIGGYAHSRDLLYVSRLLREYNTDSKIFETFELAEQSGVNMIQVAPGCVDYRRPLSQGAGREAPDDGLRRCGPVRPGAR